MSTTATVVAVGASAGTASGVADELRIAGFEITSLSTDHQVAALISSAAPDLVLVDWNVPDCTGLDICRDLKTTDRALGVILVVPRAGERERVAAFEAGADDVLVMPASGRELVLRVRAVLRRRAAGKASFTLGSLRTGTLVLDGDARRAKLAGSAIDLTLLEFRLLWTLASRAGGVQQREALLRDVWGPNVTVEARTVDQHVKRLRRKLGASGALLRTVRGVGYRFEPSAVV